MLTEDNCAPLSLLQYLQKHVTIPSSDDIKSVRLYVLADEYENSNKADTIDFRDYSPKQFGKEFLARKQLILVYQGAQIVLGMTAFEYAYKSSSSSGVNWSRAYIQYVDTTGLFQPRQNQSHLTKSLLRAYLNYCKDVLSVGTVHLLAAAKPAFLFAGSELIEGKRALPSVKLINWWIGLLQDFTKEARVFVYSPTEEAEGSSRMKKRILGIDCGKGGWTYGFPYASNLPCVDQIPLFEDDPKWRHFQATILDEDDTNETKRKRAKMQDSASLPRTNVKEFFESIQIRPEFRSDPSAFFTLQFPKRYRDASSRSIGVNRSDLATFGIKMLGGLTFESEDVARESSQKVAGWMKLMGVPSSEISKIAIAVDKENISNTNVVSEVKVNSLQSLIKKKPQTTTK